MDNTTKLILLFIALELLEASWQRASTLMGSLAKSYYFYNKSIFLLLFMHIGYLYTLYIVLALDILNWPVFFILLLKTMDIFMKINLIQKIFVRKEAEDGFILMLESPTPWWYYLIGVATYPWLLCMAMGG
jgi:hypothetical protein